MASTLELSPAKTFPAQTGQNSSDQRRIGPAGAFSPSAALLDTPSRVTGHSEGKTENAGEYRYDPDFPDEGTVVCVTAADIAQGNQSDFNTHPLFAAICNATGAEALDMVEEGEFPNQHQTVVINRHPKRSVYRLPRRAQYFIRIWRYGPSGGADIPQFAVRKPDGELICLRSYNEIISPFEFILHRYL